MKVIMVTYDSLNRHFLPNYGCDWVKAPNFERLGKRAVTFDHCYVGSMPCMPARREQAVEAIWSGSNGTDISKNLIRRAVYGLTDMFDWLYDHSDLKDHIKLVRFADSI